MTGRRSRHRLGGDASLRLIASGTVHQEINVSKIPSFSTIDPRLQNAAWNPQWTANVQHRLSRWGQTSSCTHDRLSGGAISGRRCSRRRSPTAKSNKGPARACYSPSTSPTPRSHLKAKRPELGITDLCAERRTIRRGARGAARPAAAAHPLLGRRQQAGRRFRQ